MTFSLSKNQISSYLGDVLPLHIGFDSEQHSILAKADIKWECDSDAVIIRSFEGDDPMSFNNGVLLVLNKVGAATVTATLEGVKYTCEVTVRERMTADNDGKMEYYIGDLHNHTTKIHDHDEFIARTSGFQHDYVDFIKNENLIDFCAMSDHAVVLNDTEYFRNFIEVEKAEPSDVIIFPGAESEVTVRETDRYGVVHKNSGEIVTFNSDGYGGDLTWQQFTDCAKNAPDPVAIFAHPNATGYSTKGIWNFCYHKNNTPEMIRIMRGIEVINSGAVATNLMHEFNYSFALDNGFRVSPVASSDSHGPIWGYNAYPSKTVIMAKEKSREAFIDALRNNRFYATESGNVKLKYTVNGTTAPCDLTLDTNYKFHVELSLFKEDETSLPVECSVISDGGKTVLKITDTDLTSFDFEIDSDSARYFYLRFVDANGRRTWSAPVWTGRTFDKYVEPSITPVDMSKATAIDILTGEDASAVIDGDVYNTWTARSEKASVLIDLKDEYNVCALGNYPRIINRVPRAENPKWCEADYSSTIPTSFEIYTSVDGISFEKRAEGISRMFGGENVVTFEKTLARYVRFDVLSNVGCDSVPHRYGNAISAIGNLTVFEALKN